MTNRLPDLGDRVRCRISGFTGIVTSHAKHIAGCDRMWIEPPVDASGKKVEGSWLDIDMIEIVEPEAVQRVTYNRSAPGGVDLPRPR